MILNTKQQYTAERYLLAIVTSIWSAVLININITGIYEMQTSKHLELFFIHLFIVLAICAVVAVFVKLVFKFPYSKSIGYAGCLYLFNCFREHCLIFTDNPFGYLFN
jgi:hypothetical protein